MKWNKSFPVVAFCILMLSSCSDIIRSEFSTWRDLPDVASNEAAWLPQFLYTNKQFVDNAFEIRENHDLDSNKVWGVFRYGVSPSEFIADLKKEDAILPQGFLHAPKLFEEFGISDIRNVKWYIYSEEETTWNIHIDEERNLLFFRG